MIKANDSAGRLFGFLVFFIKPKVQMHRIIFFTAFFTFLSSHAVAFGHDFNDGLIAIKNGNYEQAIRIFRVAAEKGDKHAQHCLGVLLHKGFGVKQNHEEAFKWLQLAAKQGLSQANFDLGILVYQKKGVPENYPDKY